MVNVAVLGYGTIGAGVVEVLQTNADSIEKKAGERIVVKRILDLREFPGQIPMRTRLFTIIRLLRKTRIFRSWWSVMGGLEPAYTFVKTALLQGRSVATSNKELVAKYGAELIGIAEEKKVNFLFEASVGGGIPIIRPLTQCLTADVIEEISGILKRHHQLYG